MITRFKKNKKGIREAAKSLFLWIVVILVFGFLAYTNISIKERRDKLAKASQSLKKQIAEIEAKNKELEGKISNSQSLEYAEEVARTQLNMKAAGEEVVVVSKSEESKKEQEQAMEAKNFWQNAKEFFLRFWEKK